MAASVEHQDLEQQQQKIDEAAALLTQMVDGLRRCPSDEMQVAAREALTDLRPHVEAALEALEEIKDSRKLTDRERDLEHAFEMLLAVRMLSRSN